MYPWPSIYPCSENEAIRNLYILCRKLHGKQHSFGLSMIKYVMSTWIQGSFPVITWNVFNYDGVNTNNNSEAYNSKLGAKLKPHPNVYFLFKELKSEMESSRLDAIAAQTGNRNFKCTKHKKIVEMNKRRNLMKEKLNDGKVDLLTYQQSMGGLMKVSDIIQDDDEDDHFFNQDDNVADDPIEVPSLENIFVPLPVLASDQDQEMVNIEYEPSDIVLHEASKSKKC